MNSFVFKKTALDLAQYLASQPLYGELVITTPAIAAETKGDLSLASGGNYASMPLVNVVASYEGNGSKCGCDDLVWDNLTLPGGNQIKGLAVCRRAGGAPASTDRVISYIACTPFIPNGVDFTFVFPATGFFRIA